MIVSDGASPDTPEQHQVVEEVLRQIGADTQPRIDVLNKCDLLPPGEAILPVLPGALRISARTGMGLDALLAAIARELRKAETRLTLLVPFSQYGVIGELRQKGRVIEEIHEENGTKVTVMLPGDAAGQIAGRYGALILRD